MQSRRRRASPLEPCSFRIVDDARRFVGESTPRSKFSLSLPPGHHAFFVWQLNGDVPRGKYPNVNQVGAVEGDFEAGTTYVVDVSITNAEHGLRKSCFAYQSLALRFVDPATPAVAGALARAAPTAPDLAAGQAAVAEDPADVAMHVEFGTRKLRR